jgi:hypothetical protein
MFEGKTCSLFKSFTIIPDGWIDFRINTHTQICLWLEMDMGTMDQKPFKKKVSSLLDFSKEDYTRVFGTPSLTIAFATPSGEHCMRSLLTWIEQELTIRQAERNADLFRLLCIPKQDLCSEQLFLSPICARLTAINCHLLSANHKTCQEQEAGDYP